jgi:hypothetical protein
MDRYFENMVKVSYDVMEPKEAAEEVESWVVFATSRQAPVECMTHCSFWTTLERRPPIAAYDFAK